jgi:AraC-like DNA-binding protein
MTVEKKSRQKPVLEKVLPRAGRTFKTGIYDQQYFKRSWHFHPEAELLLITDGYGIRLVGDSAEEFGKDDLVLVGGYLPHAWISDPIFYEPGAGQHCKSIFIQFCLRDFGDQFVQSPEMGQVRKLMKLAERGISIQGPQRTNVIRMVRAMPGKEGVDRLTSLLTILGLINECQLKPLASAHYLTERFFAKSTRIADVHEFIMENFKDDISLGKAAGIACMNPSAFARYFKAETGLTFSSHLNEMRIDFSCKLLKGTGLPVSQIAFQSGYNSLPYFNRKFMELTGLTPKEYRSKEVNAHPATALPGE